MKNLTIKVAIVASFFTFGGCSTYNSYAPDWAKIGSSTSEPVSSSETTDQETKWWNPFSWF